MILEDFTMLGTTVPEPTKTDGRVFVCSAGISPEMGLVRIYPLARRNIPRRWSTYRVPLERNPRDSRKESWQVRGDRSEGAHEYINSAFEKVGELKRSQRRDLLSKYLVESIQEANSRRMSLAILQPKIGDLDFDFNPESPASPMLKLFDVEQKPAEGAKRFPYIPRLHFRDESGPHHLMIRDWGCFEWMRKYPQRYKELPQCLNLNEDSSLLIGNFNQHRTSWLIISVLSGIRESEPTLFDHRPHIPT
jgi:hypothetical protein